MKRLAALVLICLIGAGCILSHSHCSTVSSLSALVQSCDREAAMDFDSADVDHLQPHPRELLREIAVAMKSRHPHDRLSIEGHTGRFIIIAASNPLILATSEPPGKWAYYPSDQVAISVSERMALAVREYLVHPRRKPQERIVPLPQGSGLESSALGLQSRALKRWYKPPGCDSESSCRRLAHAPVANPRVGVAGARLPDGARVCRRPRQPRFAEAIPGRRSKQSWSGTSPGRNPNCGR